MSDAAPAAPPDTQGHGAQGHAGGTHVNYIAKFWWLVGLTVTEVAVALKVGPPYKLPLLAVLSGWKAAIVLNYFMHLKTERIGLKLLVAFPAVLIVVLVTLFLMDGYFLGYSAL
jgi:heme/copper-type cytochrome/quinol oxidase subunit 4